jgi:hypothetical protein
MACEIECTPFNSYKLLHRIRLVKFHRGVSDACLQILSTVEAG